MKRIIQKSLLAIPVLVLGASVLLGSVARAAGTANLYLTPSSGSYTVGDTISVGIYEDSGGDTVNSVQANLSYDTSYLTYSSISSTPNFGVTPQNTGGGGTDQIGRGANTPVSGAQLVATVRFTASAAGTAAVNFASGNLVVRSPDAFSEVLSTAGASFSIAAPATPPAPPPPPSPSPSPSPSPTPSPSPSSSSSSKSSSSTKASPPPAPSPTPSPTPTPSPSPSPTASPSPAASNTIDSSSITVSNLSTKTATISWTTAVPTTTEIDYGPSTQYGISMVDPKLVTNHTVVLSSKILLPGTTFHYVVKGVDAKGNLVSGGDNTFATLKTGSSNKKSGVMMALVVVGIGVALTIIGGGTLLWFKKGSLKPQWSGYEPAANTSAGPAGQVVKPVDSGEIKPENIINPGSGPKPPA